MAIGAAMLWTEDGAPLVLRVPQDERGGTWSDGGDASPRRLYASVGTGAVLGFSTAETRLRGRLYASVRPAGPESPGEVAYARGLRTRAGREAGLRKEDSARAAVL